MPRWGLTTAQIDAKPWGIPGKWLAPAKTVTDPVHGDIYINELEQAFMDSVPMQRLRRVRQLGTTHLVYPAATHNRFSHALGTLRAAQDLLDAVVATRHGPRPAQDLFSEWVTTLDRDGISEYDQKLAEVTVLARLGALLHDLAHVPFGHTIEDELKVLAPHDANWPRFDRLWGQLPNDLRGMIAATSEGFFDELTALIVSKESRDGTSREIASSRYPFVSDIVGNTICADLIDYLQRDHLNTGLPMALGERFTTDFYVNNSKAVRYPARMVIRITRNGRERVDVVSELLKYLRYRYELSERVLTHHAKLAADAMIGKLLEMWSDWLWVDRTREVDAGLALRHGRDVAQLRERLKSHPAATGGVHETLEQEIGSQVEAALENAFTRRGDDGLLEYLRDWGEEGAVAHDLGNTFGAPDDGDGNKSRRVGVGQLANQVLNRHLYKLIGRANQTHALAIADTLYKQFGSPDARRELEIGAARRAGVEPRWGAVIWLPPAGMRLKVAGVLVDQDGDIAPLDNVGHQRGSEIYDAHGNLWAIGIYGIASLSDNRSQADVVLAHIAEQMQVRITRVDGTVVPSLFDLVIEEVVRSREGSRQDEARLRDALAPELVGHSGALNIDRTYKELVEIAHEFYGNLPEGP